jgi:ABC-type nitrate/sulfonate/bicarbonate transport system substrate-binding protein
MPQLKPFLPPITRDLLIGLVPIALLIVLALWAAFAVLKPAPPRRVVLLTGSEQGAYAEFGRRYAQELRRYGIEVQLHPTRGAADNLRMLRDPAQPGDIGFVQGGSGEAVRAVDEDTSGHPLVSLGGLFYEPVWLFYRESAIRKGTRTVPLTELAQLQGLRINTGARGSGAPNLFNKLLFANGIERSAIKESRLDPTAAVSALLASELDAIVFVSAPESPLVQMLLLTPGVKLADFAQADAYTRRLPFLTALVLPEGVADLARDIPPQDARLIAPTAELIAREGTHPALLQLFVQAAQKIHGETGWFARTGQFPRASDTGWPLAPEAARIYRSGPPLLQRYLPFWLANVIDRMWVALASILVVLIPLVRLIPPVYTFRIRSRVFRWYRRLREIEAQCVDGATPHEKLAAELQALEDRVEKIAVPLSYADQLYSLKSHIELVRSRLKAPSSALQ